MFSRRWDPGIINGEWIGGYLYRIKGSMYTGTRFRSDQRCMVMEFKGVYSEKIRKIGIIGEQDSVSIILKMKSNVFKGNIFHSLQLSISFSFEGKGICGMNGSFDKIGIWRVLRPCISGFNCAL